MMKYPVELLALIVSIGALLLSLARMAMRLVTVRSPRDGRMERGLSLLVLTAGMIPYIAVSALELSDGDRGGVGSSYSMITAVVLAVATVIVAAVEPRLYRRTLARVKQLVIEHERAIAQDIHDNIVQGLATAKAVLELGVNDATEDALSSTLEDARRLSSRYVESLQSVHGTVRRSRLS